MLVRVDVIDAPAGIRVEPGRDGIAIASPCGQLDVIGQDHLLIIYTRGPARWRRLRGTLKTEAPSLREFKCSLDRTVDPTRPSGLKKM